MDKTFKIALTIVGGIVLVAVVLGLGLTIAQANGIISLRTPSTMMGWTHVGTNPGYAMMGDGFPMMRRVRPSSPANAKPLTVDQAKQAVESYLQRLNNPDLELNEIMIFDNNAYARITEKSTGIGAMELLVDPANLAVFPEYGPNMMWNLKYGHSLAPASRAGMGGNRNGMTLGQAPRAGVDGNGGMMNGDYRDPGSASATMTVSSDQAAQIAQKYLDQQFPGSKAAADPDPFYGYYTIDILKDGKPTGMLSVNGFSGQVFLHTWHGSFIEKSE